MSASGLGGGSGSSRRFPNEASRSLRRSIGLRRRDIPSGCCLFQCVLSTMADAYPARPGRCAPRRRRSRPPLVYRAPRTRDLLAHPRLPIGTGEAGDPDGSFKPPREQLATAKTQKSHRQKSSFSLSKDYRRRAHHLPFGFFGPWPTTWKPFPLTFLTSGKLMLFPFFAPFFLLAFTTSARRHTKTFSPSFSCFL